MVLILFGKINLFSLISGQMITSQILGHYCLSTLIPHKSRCVKPKHQIKIIEKMKRSGNTVTWVSKTEIVAQANLSNKNCWNF